MDTIHRFITNLPLPGARGWRRIAVIVALVCILLAARVVLLALAPVPSLVLSLPPAGTAQGLSLFAPTPGSAGGETLDTAAIDAVVMGVITRGEQAWANIAVAGATDRVYSRGDELAPGVRIERISPALVVVLEHGQLRRIPLRSLMADSASGTVALSREGAPVGAVSTLEISAATTDDGSQALRLDAVDAAAAAQGLVAGDVVVAVDGQPLAALWADGDGLAALAATDGDRRVRVLRDGGEVEITIGADILASWITRR